MLIAGCHGVWHHMAWANFFFFWRAFPGVSGCRSASLFELITRGATALCSAVWCGANSSKNLRRGTAGFAPCFRLWQGIYIYPSFSFILPKARQGKLTPSHLARGISGEFTFEHISCARHRPSARFSSLCFEPFSCDRRAKASTSRKQKKIYPVAKVHKQTRETRS